MFLIITASSIGCAVGILQSTAEKSQDAVLDSQFLDYNITIPDDYSTIQEGLDNAKPDDKILVRSGVYKETIEIKTSGIYLHGENKFNTTIDGEKTSKSTITIFSPDVTVDGFSIINGDGEKAPWDTAGVYILSSDVTIKDNLIKWNLLGINALDTAHNLTITYNSFTEDSIVLGNYEHTTNKFTKESFLHTITNNTINGKPFYYFKNKKNFVVPDDAGSVILANCTNVTIKDTYFTHVDFPVTLGFCNKCVIENITVENTYGEIILLHSENCTIQDNTASHIIYGVCLDYESKNNIVRYNDLSHNYGGIVVMTSSSNNVVYQNDLHHNSYGIFLYNKSHNNTILENKIYDNAIGIKLQKTPYDNIIRNNTIRRCPVAAMSICRSKNTWDHNYYNRPHILPKLIFSYRMIGKIPVPFFVTGFDLNPAVRPKI